MLEGGGVFFTRCKEFFFSLSPLTIKIMRIIFRIKNIETDNKTYIRVFVSHPSATKMGKIDFPFDKELFQALGSKFAYDITQDNENN